MKRGGGTSRVRKSGNKGGAVNGKKSGTRRVQG